MLAMTQEAVTAVERIVRRDGMPKNAVVRIATEESRDNGHGAGRAVQIEVMPRPPSRDLLVEDMRIAVEPSSLAYLDDKVLDASIAGDQVEFTLYPQPNG